MTFVATNYPFYKMNLRAINYTFLIACAAADSVFDGLRYYQKFTSGLIRTPNISHTFSWISYARFWMSFPCPSP